MFIVRGSLKLDGVKVLPVNPGPFTQRQLVAAFDVTAAADGLDN
jgi:hypothetical protein